MKSKSKILILTIGMLVILTLNVYASNTSLQVSGKEKVEAGSTETMTLKLVSDADTVGVVSGKIKGNESIESIEMQGKNGWQVTYNKAAGEFNILKAEGAKTEEIADITYKVKATATGKANINISNTELTTIEYTTINGTNINKEVTINSGNETSTPTPNGGSESTPTPSTRTDNTPVPTANPTQNNGVVQRDNQITTSSKDTTGENSKKVATTAVNSLPKAGISNFLIITVLVILIISIICYIKYKEYKY